MKRIKILIVIMLISLCANAQGTFIYAPNEGATLTDKLVLLTPEGVARYLDFSTLKSSEFSDYFHTGNSNGLSFDWAAKDFVAQGNIMGSTMQMAGLDFIGNQISSDINLNLISDSDDDSVLQTLNLWVGTQNILSLSKTNIVTLKSIVPLFDSNVDLGTALKRFNNIFGVTGNFSGVLTANGASFTDDVNITGSTLFGVGGIFSATFAALNLTASTSITSSGTISSTLGMTANGGSQVWDASNLNGAAFDFDAKDLDIYGDLGIGTVNPEMAVDVRGVDALKMQLATSDYVSNVSGSRIRFYFGSATGNTYTAVQTTDVGGLSASDLILQPSSGNLGVGNVAPSEKLDVTGNGLFSGSVTGTVFIPTSDRNAKENMVRDLEPRKLETKYYHYNLKTDKSDENGNKRKQYSIMAQDLIDQGYGEYVYESTRKTTNEKGEEIEVTVLGVNIDGLHSEEISYLKYENEKLNSLINSLVVRLNLLEDK